MLIFDSECASNITFTQSNDLILVEIESLVPLGVLAEREQRYSVISDRATRIVVNTREDAVTEKGVSKSLVVLLIY
jgi:hypothetical protein